MPGILKFVILSDARSGTSLLSKTLNSHPDITCHGEVFHPDLALHLRVHPDGPGLDEMTALRERDEMAYLDRIFDQPGCRAVGFKMWIPQSPACCDAVLADDSIAKIIHERENLLAGYSSSRLAKQTGVWNLAPEEARGEELGARTGFSEKWFKRYVARHRKMFAHYREAARGPVLESTHLKVLNEGFGGILSFLGVDPMPLEHQKIKLHGSDIIERFQTEDRQRALDALNKLGHEEWVRE